MKRHCSKDIFDMPHQVSNNRERTEIFCFDASDDMWSVIVFQSRYKL